MSEVYSPRENKDLLYVRTVQDMESGKRMDVLDILVGLYCQGVNGGF